MIPPFRFSLFSLFLFPFTLEECHNIQPCGETSTPLTEPDLKISFIRLFGKTHTTSDSVYMLCTILGFGNGYRFKYSLNPSQSKDLR